MRKGGIKHRVQQGLSLWLDFAFRRPFWVILTVLIMAGVSISYTLSHLKINTYPGNMLSDSLPWRQDKLALEKAFPDFRDSLVLVIDAPSSGQAYQAAEALARVLESDREHFEWVFYPPREPYFRKASLLYLDLPDLDSRIEQLSKAQPFLADLSRDPDLEGAFRLLGRALRQDQVNDLGLSPLFDALSDTLENALAGKHQPLSWDEVMSGRLEAQDHRVLLEVMPRLEFSSLAPGREMLEIIRLAGKDLDLERQGIRLRITGAVALSIDELQSASIGAQMASLGSFVGVALVMLLGLRSLWLVMAVQLGLVLGLVFTASFAAVALGELNLISVAFSVMYIGIGADYGIYLCLRYRELCGHYPDPHQALKRAVRHVGGSLEIGTLTTAIGFFCFMPTSYRGVAELGIISGVGMFISLAVTLLVLPAILGLIRPKTSRGGPTYMNGPIGFGISRVLMFPMRHARFVLGMSLLLGALGVIALGYSRFDLNPLNLQDPHRESVVTFQELLKEGKHSPWSLSILAPDDQAAMSLKAALQALSEVEKVRVLQDFLPKEQEAKLELVDGLTVLYGGSLGAPREERVLPPNDVGTLREFLGDLSGFLARNPGNQDSLAGSRLQLALAGIVYHLGTLTDAPRKLFLDQLSGDLTQGLRWALERLSDAMKAGPVTIEDLPSDLVSRWKNAQGILRVEVQPREDLADQRALEQFVNAVRSVAVHATGVPVLFLESSRAVVKAFLEAFGYAIFAISLVLMFSLPRKRDVWLVLVPLLLSSILTGAIMVLFKIPFNFANIIALPLVFGMGVDNCIHMVHRYRTDPPRHGVLLNTSTALAVLLSAMTNVSGFGNLAVSPHQGMASMGLMLSIGILSTLVSTMMVLPALLHVLERREKKTELR